jgi:UDP-N-acetylmuramoyl-tripeptide--D-alanyl-D-alanine ligase
MDTLLAAVKEALPGAGSVLVKGSRFMAMERVVEAIAAAGRAAHSPQEPGQNNNKQKDTLEGTHGATH